MDPNTTPATQSPPPTQPQQPITPKRPFSLNIYSKLLVIMTILLALLLVFAVIYHAVHKTSTTNTSAGTVKLAGAEVKITSTGFDPSTIQVNQNTTVEFLNTDSKPHWVASDPYPTDNNLPTFNSQKALQPNEGWDYTFASTGTFTFHDQLNPYSFNGSVIVK